MRRSRAARITSPAVRPTGLTQRVEPHVGVVDLMPQLPQSRPQRVRQGENAAPNPPQARRPVVRRIHPGHDRQQHLRPCRCCWWPSRAGCAARAFAASGGNPSRRRRPSTCRSGGPALPRVLSARRHERRVRAAEAHRYAETLRRTNRNIGANSPGGLSSVRASKSVATTASPPAAWFAQWSSRSTRRARPLWGTAAAPKAGLLREIRLQRVPDHHLETQRRARVCTTAIVWGWQSCATKKHLLLPLLTRAHHRHRFGGRSRLVQQRSVGQRQGGQVAHHRLEIHQGFEAAL